MTKNTAADSHTERVCGCCGAAFLPSSAAQLYCAMCGDEGRGRLSKVQFPADGDALLPTISAQKYESSESSASGITKLPVEPRVCPQCGMSFVPRIKTQLSCSRGCANRRALGDDAKRLRECGCGRSYVPRTKDQTHCSPGCRSSQGRAPSVRPSRGAGPRSAEGESRGAEKASPSSSATAGRHQVDPQTGRGQAGTQSDLIYMTCTSCGLEQSELNFPMEGSVCLECLPAVQGELPSRQLCGYCEHLQSGTTVCGDCMRIAQLSRDSWRCKKPDTRGGPESELVLPQRVWEAADHICCVCLLPTIEGSESAVQPVMQHLLPKEEGGSHTYENIGCAHQFCSTAKAEGLDARRIRDGVIRLINAECQGGR